MLLKDLLRDVPYIKVDGSSDVEVREIYYDSRMVTPGSLFFCIKGAHYDGHQFALQASENGAAVVVVQRDVLTPPNVVKVFVEDTRRAMALISSNFFGNPTKRISLVGVTGTNGKTSVTYLIKSILEQVNRKVGLIGTITNMIGDKKIPSKRTTPESLDLQRLFRKMVDEGVENIVMEVSSHSLSLERVAGCIFDVAAFTNLTQDHLDFHGTLDEYRNAKVKLFHTSNISVINMDDESGQIIKSSARKNVISYGIKEAGDIYAEDVKITLKGVSFQLCTPNGTTWVNLGIPGIFSVYNAMAAAGVCYALGISNLDIKQGLENVKGVPGRFELLDTNTEYSVILDYAHTPDSLENILKTARNFAKGRVVVLFGCGGDRDLLKRPIMGEIAGRLSDFCIVTSDNPRGEDPTKIINDILPGVERTGCSYMVIEDRREAIKYALINAQKDDIIILAGKGHEEYQELKNETIHFNEKEIVAEILGRKTV